MALLAADHFTENVAYPSKSRKPMRDSHFAVTASAQPTTSEETQHISARFGEPPRRILAPHCTPD